MSKHISFKRALAMLLAAMMLLSVTACGGSTGDKTTTASSDTTAPTEDTTKAPDQPVEDEKNVVLYVAPDGNDETGNPYATLEAAKLAVRAMDKTNLESITVYFKEGHYEVMENQFSAEDSGTETCLITYAAYRDEEVIMGGAKVIPTSAFHPVEEEAILARLSEDAKAHVLAVSLNEIGISPEEAQAFYASTQDTYNRASVYVNGKRQIQARYPDGEYALTGGLKKINGEERRFKITDELAERIAAWDSYEDIWMFGFWKYDWADSIERFESLEITDEYKAVIMATAHGYGISKGNHYFYFNVLEELTAPGEWYIDWQSGMLYYYPDANWDSATISVSLGGSSILGLYNTQYVNFNNLIFEGVQGNTVATGGVNQIHFDHCKFRCSNGNALVLRGNNIHLTYCEINDIGTTAIDVDGGDRQTLTTSGNLFENCYIHDYGQIRHEAYGFWLNGVGTVIRSCEICNAPFGGIRFFGNEHTIEYCEFHHLDYEVDDAGSIYAGRHFDFYGNVIRYNYFHDICSPYSLGVGNFYAPKYIYEDDSLCGTTVYGNLFVGGEGCYSSVKMGGLDSICCNNIFIDDNGLTFAGGAVFADSNNENDVALRESPFMSEIWIERYPQMDKYRHGKMDGLPKTAEEANVVIKHNLCFVKSGRNTGFSINDCLGNALTYENNYDLTLDDLSIYFTDPAKGDYTMKPDAPIFFMDPNFEEIPFAQMGRRDV